MAQRTKQTVGWREWLSLPDLGVKHIKVKVDTGARTSAIHALKIMPFEKNGEEWVRFEVRPDPKVKSLRIPCEAKILDRRNVRSSSGSSELRYVIKTRMRFGGKMWPIELTLTNRSVMGFKMLLGRQGLKGRFIVDPGSSFLLGEEGQPS